MKGLIRNNFYSTESQLKSVVLFNMLLILISIITGESSFITNVLPILIFMFVVNTGTAMHIDTVAKWTQFELTMPIKRKTVIDARYLFFLIINCFGVLLSTLTILVAYIMGISLDFERVGFALTFGIILAFETPAFMYPLMLKFGTDKNEIIMVVSAVLSVLTFGFLAWVLSPFVVDMDNANIMVRGVGLLVAFLLFIGSYFLSVSMYNKKEF